MIAGINRDRAFCNSGGMMRLGARSICELSMHALVYNVYVRSLDFRRKEIKNLISSASKRDSQQDMTADDLHYSRFCDTDVPRAKKATNLTWSLRCKL